MRTLHYSTEKARVLLCVLLEGKWAFAHLHKKPSNRVLNGAGEEIRTLDIFVGNEVLYQLSYTRVEREAV